MFYGFRVKHHWFLTVPRGYRKEFPGALHRALKGLGKPYAEMLARLEAHGLTPREAAPLAADWVSRMAPSDRTRSPVSGALLGARETLLAQLEKEYGRRVVEKIEAVAEAEKMFRRAEEDREWDARQQACEQPPTCGDGCADTDGDPP